jgi:hypothetical protein
MYKVAAYEVNACETHAAEVHAADIYRRDARLPIQLVSGPEVAPRPNMRAEYASLLRPRLS